MKLAVPMVSDRHLHGPERRWQANQFKSSSSTAGRPNLNHFIRPTYEDINTPTVQYSMWGWPEGEHSLADDKTLALGSFALSLITWRGQTIRESSKSSCIIRSGIMMPRAVLRRPSDVDEQGHHELRKHLADWGSLASGLDWQSQLDLVLWDSYFCLPWRPSRKFYAASDGSTLARTATAITTMSITRAP